MAVGNYSGPRLAPNAACRASRKPSGGDETTQNRPSVAPDAISQEALAGPFRGHGVSLARRGLARRGKPMQP